jgi:DNA-binding NarL/FixJ family response regulator
MAGPARRRITNRERRRPGQLTARERQILRLIWSGLRNREIAGRLKISVKTAETHRAAIMKKLRVSNTAQLIKTAIADRLLNVSQQAAAEPRNKSLDHDK